MSNAAVTGVYAFMVIVQSPVPLQPPPFHPVKYEPASGIAVSVAIVTIEYVSVQSLPQSIPDGELVTMPLPVPVLLIVNV